MNELLGDDDEHLIAVLRMLDDEPDGPGRIDLAGAISEARRRRRIRRTARVGGTALLAVAAVAAVPLTLPVLRPGPAVDGVVATGGPAPTGAPTATGTATPPGDPAGTPVPIVTGTTGTVTPPTRCTVSRLPVPDGHPKSLVTGADPSGRWILGRSYPTGSQGGYPVLVWEDGKPRRVDLPGGDQTLRDVNSTGLAVGFSYVDDGPRPYLYRDGKVSSLPGVPVGQALAVNQAGQIVGYRDSGRDQPVIWSDAAGPPADLPLPDDGSRGEAVDIDEDGTVLGVLIDRSGQHEYGYLWRPDGTAQKLPTPQVAGQPAESFRPQSIRNGWVAGVATRAETGSDPSAGHKEVHAAVRLHLPTGRFVEVPGRAFWPQVGNAQGWLGGFAGDRNALATDAGQLLLPELHERKAAGGNTVWTLSDDGRIAAGQSEDAAGEPQAVLWRCR
ncbi:hypothetical protein [Plantactinospora endophytica]|uniref:HAF repeat-containing protein n=1 Tax=Plantactinospora endophytica TaxID=673535 RepID=A0ABQ4DWQ6_9ACTN|nr:hypothetical protein [Plantactinospora endophytica]GIG86895.1 hypothetical protein Pen02_18310 [Plantactinospora endophytica]